MKRNSLRIRSLAFVMLFGIVLSGGYKLAAAGGLKPIQFTVYIGHTGQPPMPDNKISKLIKKEFGIMLKYEFAVDNNDQNIGIMIAGSDYPDIITGDTRLVNAGAFIPN